MSYAVPDIAHGIKIIRVDMLLVIFAVIKIVSRFELSKNFGKKTAFGFGLWLLPVIFDSILEFSNTIKYSEED